MRYTGSAWELVGPAGFSDGVVIYTRLALDSSDTPYVAYRDEANSSKATVMRYTGSAWEPVGTAGFSADGVSSIELALDSNEKPYVSFPDWNYGGKATVMRYNGTSWEIVGPAGFSAGGALTYTSLALDSSDTPYVAYSDDGNSSKATLKRYNGSTWEPVGSVGFSAGMAEYVGLALDSNDTPLVVYKDWGSSSNGKATVMNYQQDDAGPAICNASGSGNWNDVFSQCNSGDRFVVPIGVTVTLDTNLELTGDLEIQGTFNPNGKTVTLTGDAPQTLTGNPLTFYRLTINKTNSTDEVTISGKLQVTSKLRVTKGKLISASDYEDIDIEATGELQLTGDITVSGNFTNTGTLTTDGWGITFNGGVSQDLVLNVATWFDDLTVDSGTTLIEVVTDDNAIVQGSLSNNGVIRKTQPVSTTDFYYFGLAGLYPDPSAYGMEIEVTDLTGGDPLTSIQVDYVAGDHTGRTGSSGNGVGWDHYWSITPTGSDFVANVTLPHDVSTPANAKACRYTGSGSVWDCKQDDVDTDYVTFSDTTEFSDWAVGEQVGPTTIKLQSLAAHNFTFSTGSLVSIGLLLAVFVAWLHRKRNRITG